jgi:DNA-binding IscR family transcriptional regulator
MCYSIYFALYFIINCISQINLELFDIAALNNMSSAHEMLVLQKFTQTTTVESENAVSEGWVFSSQALLLNLVHVLEATDGKDVYLSCDGTYKLLHNGWVLINLISETLVDCDGGQ